MRTPTAAEVLQAWEDGLSQMPVQRALGLLALACPERTPGEIEQLPIGQRDVLLLRLRERLFGSHLTGLATCPPCGEQLELSFDIADILSSVQLDETIGTQILTTGDCTISFRVPNSADLLALADPVPITSLRRRLFERCILQIERNGEPMPVEQIADQTIDAVASRMAQIDSQADVQLALTCPTCTHQWLAPFDSLTHLWNEINAWAKRILRQVHTLASAYGWPEAEILSLSPMRRQLYLEMIGA